ncbi:BspA family leucine-rich repeat surface protein [Helicobacter sp. 23-1046]
MTNENVENVENRGDLSVDSTKSTPKTLFLSEFMRESGLKPDEKSGKFIPKSRHIKDLVNCIDDCLEKTDKPINLARIDTRDITSMNRLFENSTRTKEEFSGIEDWNTSNVTSFAYAFSRAEHFDSDISGWDVSKGKGFYYMFFHAHNFNQPIGAKWHTKSAKNMRAMFCFATKFNNGGKDFGKNWVMNNVDLSAEMFYNTDNFNAGGLNEWNMTNIKKCWSMFRNARAFNQPLDKWDMPNCGSFYSMFYGAESFNKDLSAWGTRLGKVKGMEYMFADTKSLDINFLQDWQIPADCYTEHIIKGSKLEQILKTAKTQSIDEKKQETKRKLKHIAKFTISQVKDSVSIQKICENLSENKGFVVDDKSSWIPRNILNNYKVYLGKDNESKNGKDKIIKADIDDFEYAFCRIFDDIDFVITIDDTSPLDKVENINKFEIYQSSNIKDFNEINGDDETSEYDKPYTISKDNNLEFYLADASMLIINKSQNENIGDNSNTISDIINAYILAKAYKAKMQQLNTLASEYKEKNFWGKTLDFLCFWRNDTLHKVHKDICAFDLKYYQKDPVDKNKVVLDIWREMSKSYLVAQTHDELKETIKQVAELVSDENQKRFNYLMFAVAIFTAFGVALDIYRFCKGN